MQYTNLVCFFSTKMMGIMKIHFGHRVRKYDPWYWITTWLLCPERSVAARRCACWWYRFAFFFANCRQWKRVFVGMAYMGQLLVYFVWNGKFENWLILREMHCSVDMYHFFLLTTRFSLYKWKYWHVVFFAVKLTTSDCVWYI